MSWRCRPTRVAAGNAGASNASKNLITGSHGGALMVQVVLPVQTRYSSIRGRVVQIGELLKIGCTHWVLPAAK
jgi:hypothetical protein